MRSSHTRTLDFTIAAAALSAALTAGCDGASAGPDAAPVDPDAAADLDDAAAEDPDGQPVGRSAIPLTGSELYPEGVAYAADGTMYVGSLREGDIYRIPPGADEAEATPFVAAADGGLVSTLGLLVDADRGLLWACSSDPGVSPRTGEAPPAVVAFALDTGSVAGTYELPDGGLCNDLSLDAEGNLYATDSIKPRLLVLPAGGDALAVWLENDAFAGDGFNLNGIAVSGDQLYTVKYNSGDLFRIPIAGDGSAGDPVTVSLDRTLEFPDGLERESNGALVVVEGVGRLSRIDLTGDEGAVTTIASDLVGPTTAALAGGDAWVVQGQVGHLFDPDSGSPELPFQVVRVPLE